MHVPTWSPRGTLAAVAMVMSLACDTATKPGEVFSVTVKTTLLGRGAGDIAPPAGVTITDCDTTIGTARIRCFSFKDAGAGGKFSVTAVPDPGSLFGGWFEDKAKCDSIIGADCYISFDTTPHTFELKAKFDIEGEACVEEKDAVPDIVTGVGPPVSLDNEPDYDEEALINPSFESNVSAGTVGALLPDAYGYWQGDLTSRVAGQQGITPQHGSRMLQFIATGNIPGPTGTAEMIQLVKVSHLRADVDSGWVSAVLSAKFNRVAGCVEETDTSMLLVVAAMPGPPSEAQARWSAGLTANTDSMVTGGWLARFRVSAIMDGDPNTWDTIALQIPRLPVGTEYLVVDIGAGENIKNDLIFPELHGHYADSVSLVLRHAL